MYFQYLLLELLAMSIDQYKLMLQIQKAGNTSHWTWTQKEHERIQTYFCQIFIYVSYNREKEQNKEP